MRKINISIEPGKLLEITKICETLLFEGYPETFVYSLIPHACEHQGFYELLRMWPPVEFTAENTQLRKELILDMMYMLIDDRRTDIYLLKEYMPKEYEELKKSRGVERRL